MTKGLLVGVLMQFGGILDGTLWNNCINLGGHQSDTTVFHTHLTCSRLCEKKAVQESWIYHDDSVIDHNKYNLCDYGSTFACHVCDIWSYCHRPYDWRTRSNAAYHRFHLSFH